MYLQYKFNSKTELITYPHCTKRSQNIFKQRNCDYINNRMHIGMRMPIIPAIHKFIEVEKFEHIKLPKHKSQNVNTTSKYMKIVPHVRILILYSTARQRVLCCIIFNTQLVVSHTLFSTVL